MKSTITLSNIGLDGRAFIGTVSTGDFEIDVGLGRTPTAACRKAAKTLRAMADKFDMLAKDEYPLREEVQTRINYAKKVKT